MALPQELQQELKKIKDLPHAAEIEEAIKGHESLALARMASGGVGASNAFNSAVIACENLHDAETLARVYAKSLSLQKLVVEQDKQPPVLDWQSIFNEAAGDPRIINERIDEAFKAAEGTTLIISEPYQCPHDMTPRDFTFANYPAVLHLMEKMDEVDPLFDVAFDVLYKKNKDMAEIERQMSDIDFENPRKPVVVIIGKPLEMNAMVAEDPHIWNMRFSHQFGIDRKTEGPLPRPRGAPKP